MTPPAYTAPQSLSDVLIECDALWVGLSRGFVAVLDALQGDPSLDSESRRQANAEIANLDRASRLLRRIQTARLQIFSLLHPAAPRTPKASSAIALGTLPVREMRPLSLGPNSSSAPQPSLARENVSMPATAPVCVSAPIHTTALVPSTPTPTSPRPLRAPINGLLPSLSHRATALPPHLLAAADGTDLLLADEINDALTGFATHAKHDDFVRTIEAMKENLLRPARPG